MVGRKTYLGGSSILRARNGSNKLSFGSHDEAEEKVSYGKHATSLSAKGNVKNPRTEEKQSVSIASQRAFLLSLATDKVGKQMRIPERIDSNLKQQVMLYGGLESWASIVTYREKHMAVISSKASSMPPRAKIFEEKPTNKRKYFEINDEVELRLGAIVRVIDSIGMGVYFRPDRVELKFIEAMYYLPRGNFSYIYSLAYGLGEFRSSDFQGKYPIHFQKSRGDCLKFWKLLHEFAPGLRLMIDMRRRKLKHSVKGSSSNGSVKYYDLVEWAESSVISRLK